jgi:7-cyano-7-deazaguanine reductase
MAERIVSEPSEITMLGRSVEPHEYGRLELFPVAKPVRVSFHTEELEALCPAVQGVQPDRYDAEISYTAVTHALESKSVKLWLVTFRDRRIFAEALAVELHDAIAAFEPAVSDVTVRLTQSIRGGIITTVSYPVGK